MPRCENCNRDITEDSGNCAAPCPECDFFNPGTDGPQPLNFDD